MPIQIFRQPIFHIAQFILRPILPYLGIVISNSGLPIYYAIWKFSQVTLRNVGVIDTIKILWNLKRYILQKISFLHLNRFINTISPELAI